MDFNKYINTKPYPSKSSPGFNEAREAYREESRRIEQEFKKDLLEDLGITDHPKADLLYSKACDIGSHSSRSEIYGLACDLVDLIL